ncbi:MAG: 2'-5' RNA ligase family protein [Halobacteriaceae archaeon]
MYSLNAPVPPAVRALADDLAPALTAADDVRDEFTLVVKRLRADDRDGFRAVRERVRGTLAGAPAVAARVDEVGVFRDPPAGDAPVIYLAVESPGLLALHRRLCDAVDPVPGIEGDAYAPHVTVARGGDPAVADRLAGRAVGPVEWTVDELAYYDGRHGEQVGTVSLPR